MFIFLILIDLIFLMQRNKLINSANQTHCFSGYYTLPTLKKNFTLIIPWLGIIRNNLLIYRGNSLFEFVSRPKLACRQLLFFCNLLLIFGSANLPSYEQFSVKKRISSLLIPIEVAEFYHFIFLRGIILVRAKNP